MKYQIVYTHGDTLTSNVIRRITWGTSSHVAVVYDGISYEALTRGVVARPAEELFEAHGAYAIYEVDASIRVLDFLKAQVGKPYDFNGIVGILFHRDWQDDARWFCSELIAAAFAFDGRPLLRATRLGRITPTILEMSPVPQLLALV